MTCCNGYKTVVCTDCKKDLELQANMYPPPKQHPVAIFLVHWKKKARISDVMAAAEKYHEEHLAPFLEQFKAKES